MSKPVFRKSLQKFNTDKNNKEALKCYLCGQLLLGESFADHARICSRGLKRVQLPKITANVKEEVRIRKKTNPTPPMGATQPIMSMTSTRLKPIQQNSCIQELKIVKNWIEKDEMENNNEKEEVSDALRDSTILLEKIKDITRSKSPSTTYKRQPSKSPSKVREQEHDEMTTNAFWKAISKFEVNGKNRQEMIILVLSTDFTESVHYDHLECYKQQIQEIEEILKTLVSSNTKTNNAVKKYQKLQLDILQSIMSSRPKQQSAQVLRPKTASTARQLQTLKTEQNFTRSICTQCASQIGFGDICTVLPCGHRYHPECAKELSQCPLCQ